MFDNDFSLKEVLFECMCGVKDSRMLYFLIETWDTKYYHRSEEGW